jgi:hypothetical protein
VRNHYKYVGMIAQAGGAMGEGFVYVGGWEHAPDEGPTPSPQPELLMMMAQVSKEQCRFQIHSAPVLWLTPSLQTPGD